MMAQSQRKLFLFLILMVNVAVTVVTLIQAGGSHGFSANELLHAWAYGLVYANVTGIPAILLLPPMIERLMARRWPTLSVVMIGVVLFVALGSLLAQLLLMWTGLVVPQHFWREYFYTLRLGVLIAVIFGLGAFFYASLRERVRQAEQKLHEKELSEERASKLAAEAQLRSLESRIHPHFLFNTLNSISSLITMNPVQAEQMVGRLATLLRSSLDTTTQPSIPLRQELAMVRDYLEIENARFGSKLRGGMEVPDELLDSGVPPFSIQSLVENAVKHGIAPQAGGGEVLVTASVENGSLRIEVSDTGPGFDLRDIRADHGLDSLVRRLDSLFGPSAHLNVLQRNGRCVVEMVLPRS
jgi:two-component system sensor histidine kinase AlgZ